MNNNPLPSPTNIESLELDVRPIPCREKHAQIFRRWAELDVGSHFVLVNDHDPIPLYYQFEAQFAGTFAWEYLEQGPDEFRVKISRIGVKPRRAEAAEKNATPVQVNADVDARGLLPPEPMMRILAEMDRVLSGQALTALTDREPIHLIAELEQRGVQAESRQLPDGSWFTRLSRA